MEKTKEIYLYIIRHGETEWNVQRKFQGQLDSQLTKLGKRTLEEVGKELQNIDFQGVYTSNLRRAEESARIIMGKNRNIPKKTLKIKSMEELNEIYFGDWQGLTFEEIKRKYPEECYNYFNNHEKYSSYSFGGEELQAALDRFITGIMKILHYEGRKTKEEVINHKMDTEKFPEEKDNGNSIYTAKKQGSINENRQIYEVDKTDKLNILVVTHGGILGLFMNDIEKKGKKGDFLKKKVIKNGEYRIFSYKNGKFFVEK